MVPQKLSVACSALAACAIAATAAAQSPASQTSVTTGIGTVTTDQLKGEVVEVEGNSLLVKLSSGDLRTFKVPDERRFTIDGKEVSVHDLEPGTTLTATVKTTTTPITVRTKAVQSGKVWFVSPPHVILTLPSGENKQYEVKDDVKFVLNGKPATVFELKKGMVVSAEKIVEAPEVEITTATRVVGQAPAAPAASASAAARGAAAGAGAAAGTAPGAAGAGAAAGAAPGTGAAAASATAAGATSAATQPVAPAAEGGLNWMMWAGLIVLVLVALAVVARGRK